MCSSTSPIREQAPHVQTEHRTVHDTPNQGRIIAADIDAAANVVVGEGNTQSITTIIHNYYRRDDETLDEAKTARHLQRYLTWVQGSLGVVNLRGIKQHGPVPLPLSEVYVPLSAEVRPTRLATGKPEELTMDRLLAVNRQLVVIGGPGSGKTTVLQHVAWALAKALAADFFALQGLPGGLCGVPSARRSGPLISGRHYSGFREGTDLAPPQMENCRVTGRSNPLFPCIRCSAQRRARIRRMNGFATPPRPIRSFS